jgi:hypothetical protein
VFCKRNTFWNAASDIKVSFEGHAGGGLGARDEISFVLDEALEQGSPSALILSLHYPIAVATDRLELGQYKKL